MKGIAEKAPARAALIVSRIEGLKLVRRGKVRDVYDLGDKLLIVSTDRLSAFDCVLPTPIPDKGKVLTQVSAYWFEKTKDIAPNHFLSADLKEIQKHLPKDARLDPKRYDGRVMLVKKAERVDAECVVRGYLSGSGWKEYRKSGSVCGLALPRGLSESSPLQGPVFTPTTKADVGHDENLTIDQLSKLVGRDIAAGLETLSIKLFEFATERLKLKGLILADTKFEFGLLDGRLIVIDEMLTPDSSRFWLASSYRPGTTPASYDKQYVRDYLEKSGWNKRPPAPSLPPEVVAGTARRYREFWNIVSA